MVFNTMENKVVRIAKWDIKCNIFMMLMMKYVYTGLYVADLWGKTSIFCLVIFHGIQYHGKQSC